jgi:hypothetical protein
METLTAAWLALIVIILGIFVHHSFKPKALPFIPHNSPLPRMGGDGAFFTQAFKETGRLTRANEIMIQRFGPISQVISIVILSFQLAPIACPVACFRSWKIMGWQVDRFRSSLRHLICE